MLAVQMFLAAGAVIVLIGLALLPVWRMLGRYVAHLYAEDRREQELIRQRRASTDADAERKRQIRAEVDAEVEQLLRVPDSEEK